MQGTPGASWLTRVAIGELQAQLRDCLSEQGPLLTAHFLLSGFKLPQVRRTIPAPVAAQALVLEDTFHPLYDFIL